jgi:hypothetical protein
VAVEEISVSIYLSDEESHEQVERAVVNLLATAGLRIVTADDPIFGPWFRSMRAGVEKTARSRAGQEGDLIAAHIADARLVLSQDATITSTLRQNISPVISSLQPTKDAVVRLGAVLIVKVDWTVIFLQLTAAQQEKLDHQPNLATTPHEVMAALDVHLITENGPQPSIPGTGMPRLESTSSDESAEQS